MKRIVLRHKITIKQFLKFVSVGLLNTAIHYSIFLLLVNTFGVYYLIASTAGYLAGLINSYCCNRSWTFKYNEKGKVAHYFQFLIVNLVSLAINLIILKIGVVYFHLLPQFAQIGAIAFSMAINFIGNKFWTFSHTAEDE